MHISQFPCFANLTADQHKTLSDAWINEISVANTAQQANLSYACVAAYFGVRNMMYWGAEGQWPVL